MVVTLYTRKPMSAFAFSSEALVAYLGLDVAVEVVSPTPNAKFEELFPKDNRYTPSLYDSAEDVAINQAVAVNRYLVSLAKDDKGLKGQNTAEEMETLMWNSRVSGDLFPKFRPVLGAMFGGKKLTRQAVDGILAGTTPSLKLLEDRLTQHTYLVGERLTLADVESCGLLFVFFSFLVNEQFTKTYPAITRWANTVLNGKVFASKTNGEFSFAGPESLEVFWTFKAAFYGKTDEKKTAAAEKPVAAEKKPEETQEPTKKAGHPLAELGKSSIPIDELKRTYSNKETREEALPWFWNEFYNDEEWSLWKVDYKYNDELKMTFMSNNLIGGLFARLSASVKYMFGAAVVYGENNNNGIRGAFVVRGKDYFPAFDVAPDMDSYSFTRLDASKPEDREELNELWAWDKPLTVNGEAREIVDGKVLK